MMTHLIPRLMNSRAGRTLLCFGLLLTLAGPARAQTGACIEVLDPTTNPRQPVRELCVGRTYHLHKCGAPLPFGNVIYDPGNGTGYGAARDTIIMYATPGPRLIQQVANIGMVNVTTSRVYQVYSTARPRVLVEPCLRSVRVTLTDTTYNRYTVIFDNRAPTTTTATVGSSFSSPVPAGTGAITVRVRVTGVTALSNPTRTACPSAVFDTTITLPALPALPARALIRRLDVLSPTAAHQVRLELARLVPGGRYVVERATSVAPAAGPWTVLPDTLRPTTDMLSVTLNGAPTRRRHRYRLRQVALTDCDVGLPATATISNEAGALPLNSLRIVGSVATVRWPDYPAVGTVLAWRVRRDGVEIQRLPASARSYADPDAGGCAREICYEVAAVVRPTSAFPADSLLAFSGDSCARAPGVVPAAPYATASFDLANNLIVRARLPVAALAAEFQFSQTLVGGTAANLGTSATQFFTVVAPDTALVRGACYTATLTDTCGQQSLVSDAACPTLLRGRRSADNRYVELSWTDYRGFPATYTVEMLDDQTNAVIRRIRISPNVFTLSDPLNPQRQLPRYRVRAEVPGDTTRIVYSNFVDLGEEQLVRLPNAFTPNGDELNDTFGPVGRYELREQELTVFDRWGRELFRTSTPGQNWDGRPTGGGDIVPPGVFAYRFRGRDALGREFIQKGTVTVVR